MPYNGHTAGAARDTAAIDRLVSAVPGVREAVTLSERRLRSSGRRAARPTLSPLPDRGTPLRARGPALSTGPEPRLPADPSDTVSTLIGALLRAASVAPDRGVTYVLPDGGTDRQTYPTLLDDGLRVLAGLHGLGLVEGEPVLLQCRDNRAFLTAFWACLLGGFLPTPVGVAPSARSAAMTNKLYAAWRLLGRPLVLADGETRDRVTALGAQWEAGEEFRVASVDELRAVAPAEPAAVHPDQPVLNLLTSGSTGTPKCVRHPSRTLLARTYATALANGFTEQEVSLNWMPLDHVGGLVMYHLRDVVLGCEQVSAPTESFIRRPLNWLDWAERFRATNTWAPNFAFALVNKLSAEIDAGRWDLSSLRHICNGGEPVTVGTAHRFLDLLAPHGLPADAMVPSWGMSETSSGVTFSRMDRRDPSVGTIALDPRSLEGPLHTVPHGTAGALTLADLGPPIAGVRLRVVDGKGQTVPEGRIGRLQISGSTLMLGYFGNAEANRESMLPDGWFDTGDLGFLHEGRLVLTGRTKDMVIINGANYPAHEVEAVVERTPGIRPACAAICGVHDEDTGTDTVVVFFVPDEETAGELDATVAAVREALARELGLSPRFVVPVTETEFPRAAGGKLQRKRLLEALREGRFDGRLYGGAEERSPAENDWQLEPVWIPVRPTSEPDDRPTLLYAPATGSLATDLARSLGGGNVSVLTAGERFRIAGPDRVTLQPLAAEQHDRALEHLAERLGASPRVVLAWDLSAVPPGADPAEPAARLMVSLAALARRLPGAEVTVLTQGAAAVGVDDEVWPCRAALTGMVRTATAESMFAAIQLVDIPPGTAPEEVARLAANRYGADVVGVRDGEPRAANLRLLQRAARLGVPGEFLKPGGTVLLTGGLGGIGRSIAEYLLVSMGARLLLVGRTREEELDRHGRGAVLSGLREFGEVRYAAVDVADPDALAGAVSAAEAAWRRPLDLVVHLAATPVAPQWHRLSEHELARETLPWLRDQLRPKLGGGAAIEALLAQRPDTAVVLFSSVNGFFGGSAFGAYAAANAALDGYAHRWSARGHEVRCLGWSMWSGAGMNEGSPLTVAARRRGFGVIEPSRGLESLLAALNQPQRHLLIGVDPTNAHVKTYLAPEEFAGGTTLVAVVPEESAPPETVRRDVAAALAASGTLAQVTIVPRIARDASGAADPAEILAARESRSSGFAAPRGTTESTVARVFGVLLGAGEEGRVGRDDSFFGLGGDSIRAMQVAGGLSERFGREVPVRLLYEYPTVRELAAAIDSARPT